MIKKQKIFYSILVIGAVFIVGTIFFLHSPSIIISAETIPKIPKCGGPCSYDHFKGKCKIISISDKNIVNFKFKSTIFSKFFHWTKYKEIVKEESQEYIRPVYYLGLKCIDEYNDKYHKYPATKENLEEYCDIKKKMMFLIVK